MITKLWELGTLSGREESPLIGYRIEILYMEGDKECRESFEGTDFNQVQQDAMRFIIRHYKNESGNGILPS